MDKIHMIMFVREKSSQGLREAKNLVESLYEAGVISYTSEQVMTPSDQCKRYLEDLAAKYRDEAQVFEDKAGTIQHLLRCLEE